jgi:glycerate 2-kinase
MTLGEELRAIFRGTLELTDPRRLVRSALRRLPLSPDPVDVVALGKSAVTLLAGVVETHAVRRAFSAIPAGYDVDLQCAWPAAVPLEIAVGTHPALSNDSFDAGRRLLEFVDSAAKPVLFLVSGGASATVEQPLDGFNPDELLEVNGLLVRSGLPIKSINCVRKHLSAIKGGRLASRSGSSSFTLILSDVSTGCFTDVGSGPTVADASTNRDAADILLSLQSDVCSRLAARLVGGSVPETIKSLPGHLAELIGDNGTLVRSARFAASASGFEVRMAPAQIETDVATAALDLVAEARRLGVRELYVAGGEPTVRVTGHGRGGRATELAVRFAIEMAAARPPIRLEDFCALFAGSDGVDGNAGAAGFMVFPERLPLAGLRPEEIEGSLRDSNSRAIAERIGEPIIIPPTGNNLRDLFLLARG